MRKIIFVVLIVVLLAGLAFMVLNKNNIKPVSPSPSLTLPQSPVNSPSSPMAQLADPVHNFKSRVTKKPFGLYVTPQNSPVQPERFKGYHTGADAEYGDVTTDVPVFAIADGTVTYSNWVSGYGGVLIIKIDLEGKAHSILYGHLRPSSLPQKGRQFKKGSQMAVLGTAFSHETDGERRHLHLAILSDDRIDVRGYVQNKSELSGWIDPLSFY